MLNTEFAYIEAGYKCARARLQRDEACAQHWRQWFARAYALESEADRPQCRALFDRGYSEAKPMRR